MCCDENETVTLNARVLRVCGGDLLVRDRSNGQDVRVHTPENCVACCFRPGEDVCIAYNGIMTMSIPPQISASRIRRGCCPD